MLPRHHIHDLVRRSSHWAAWPYSSRYNTETLSNAILNLYHLTYILRVVVSDADLPYADVRHVGSSRRLHPRNAGASGGHEETRALVWHEVQRVPEHRGYPHRNPQHLFRLSVVLGELPGHRLLLHLRSNNIRVLLGSSGGQKETVVFKVPRSSLLEEG